MTALLARWRLCVVALALAAGEQGAGYDTGHWHWFVGAMAVFYALELARRYVASPTRMKGVNDVQM